MPELIEVELYRRDLNKLIGLCIESVVVNDHRVLRPTDTPPEAFSCLVGARLDGTHRHGKLLLAEFATTTGPCVVGLRFGMTGRLLIDGHSSIEQLEYSSTRNDPAWDRFALCFAGGSAVLRDQRCLGSVELDPKTDGLAPEASTISTDALALALRGRTKPIKTALLDQKILAGLGNLLADEVLWEAGISPLTAVDELSDHQLRDLAQQIRDTVAVLSALGGSNCGASFEFRNQGARCPRCGGRMRRDRVGGRSAWWCSTHQV